MSNLLAPNSWYNFMTVAHTSRFTTPCQCRLRISAPRSNMKSFTPSTAPPSSALVRFSTIKHSYPVILPRLPLVRPLQPLIPSNLLLTLPPAIPSNLRSLLALTLLLRIHLHDPLILSLLVGALVAPARHPLAARLVVDELLLLLGCLGLDAFLRGELFPGCLGFWWGKRLWESMLAFLL